MSYRSAPIPDSIHLPSKNEDKLLGESFSNFLDVISKLAKHYDYVSGTERRCYNLLWHRLSDVPVISNNALLLQYHDIAEFYMEFGKFPSILIIDDIMIHGRGIAKTLDQLENLLRQALEDKGHLKAFEDYLSFRKSFTNAVSILIYAQNAGKLLLSERFQHRIQPCRVMYSGQLRELSMYLSQELIKLNIANTTFAYSIRSKGLDVLFDENKMDAVKGWRPILWSYKQEKVILFTRLHGEACVNRISTIRFYPDRAKNTTPLITSFTMIGNLNTIYVYALCKLVSEILKTHGFRYLTRILDDENDALLSSKGQLIGCLLSMIDCYNFGEAIGISLEIVNQEQEQQKEIEKIARNFGLNIEIQKELNSIAISRSIRQDLEAAMDSILVFADPLCEIDSDWHLMDGHLNIDSVEEVNHYTEQIFYHVGSQAESSAYNMNKIPEAFHPSAYQRYTEDLDSEITYGMDGVISLARYLKNVKTVAKITTFSKELYGYLASQVATIDYGIMGVRLSINRRKNQPAQLTMLMKAGEMATYYVPQKYAVFIPAFAIVEMRYFGESFELKEAVIRFIDRQIRPLISSGKEPMRQAGLLVADVSKKQLKIWENCIRDILGNKEEVDRDLQEMYGCGQSFRGWNFLSITHQRTKALDELQTFVERLSMNS